MDWLVCLDGDVASGCKLNTTVSSATVIFFSVGKSTPPVAVVVVVVVANMCALLVLPVLPERPAFLRAAAELGSNFFAYVCLIEDRIRGVYKFV